MDAIIEVSSKGVTLDDQEEDVMDPVSIPVIVGRLPRTNAPIAVGFITAGDLIPRARIAHREFDTGTGYQRLPSRSRVNQLAKDLRLGRVDLPTALLLNLRTYDPSVNLVDDGPGRKLLRLADEALWEVDGQHRCEGLKAALEDDWERFHGYSVPFVLGLGWDKNEEMRQFFVVNSTAKSVPTTIAYDLLAELGHTIPGLILEIEEQGRSWQVQGQELAKELAEKSGIWRNRIRFSNQPLTTTTVPSAGFVNSLRPILSSAYFNRLAAGAQARVLDAYWEGQRQILPSVFQHPQDYVLQKSLGVQVMHSVFNDVLEVVRDRQESVTDAHAYAVVLEPALIGLYGDTREGLQVSGEDFWLSGEKGAAGAFSSSAGRRVLTARLRSVLPKIGAL